MQMTEPLFKEAAELIVEYQNGSLSFIQRKLNLGYSQALNLMESLEENNIVGPFSGTKPREVLIKNKIELTKHFESNGSS